MQRVANQTKCPPEVSRLLAALLQSAGIPLASSSNDGEVKQQIFDRLATSAAYNPQSYPPLEEVTRPSLTTEEAAHYLNRRPQTLRAWASLENGPIKPDRINGRLHWGTPKIRMLLASSGKGAV